MSVEMLTDGIKGLKAEVEGLYKNQEVTDRRLRDSETEICEANHQIGILQAEVAKFHEISDLVKAQFGL